MHAGLVENGPFQTRNVKIQTILLNSCSQHVEYFHIIFMILRKWFQFIKIQQTFRENE